MIKKFFKILGWVVLILALIVIIDAIFDSRETMKQQDKDKVEVSTEPATEKPKETEDPDKEFAKECRYTLMDMGYPDANRLPDHEAIMAYANIMNCLAEFDVNIEGMIEILKNFGRYKDDMTEYDIIMEYAAGYTAGDFDPEPTIEGDPGDMIENDDSTVLDWYRSVKEGDYVIIRGKVVDAFNVPGTDPCIDLYFQPDNDHQIIVRCYTDNYAEIDCIVKGDKVLVTGYYTGKNATGYAMIKIESVTLQ